MDDTQDKVRRNVVIVASLIVLLQFLDVDVRTGTTLGIFTITKISEAKFWTIASVVLIYVFQRYWFDVVTLGQRTAALEEYRRFRHAYIQRILHSEMVANTSDTPYENLVLKFEAPLVNKHLRGQMALSDLVAIELAEPRDSWSLSGRVDGWVRLRIAGTPNLHTIEPTEYSLSLVRRLKVSVLPLLRYIIFSKSNVDFIVPVTIAAVAALVCAYRLLNSQ